MMSEKTKWEVANLQDELDSKVSPIVWKFIKWGVRRMVFPMIIGFALWCGTYPLQYYSCYAYAQGKHFSDDHWDYRWFTCYIKAEDNHWYTQAEYQASQVGARVIVAGGNLFGVQGMK